MTRANKDLVSCIKDCNDDEGGSALVDECGSCVGGETGKTACAKDCNGDWGGAAYVDECGSCVGGETGRTACEVDCHGVPGGSASLDDCGACVGGDTNEIACVLDCNGDWNGTAYVDNSVSVRVQKHDSGLAESQSAWRAFHHSGTFETTLSAIAPVPSDPAQFHDVWKTVSKQVHEFVRAALQRSRRISQARIPSPRRR